VRVWLALFGDEQMNVIRPFLISPVAIIAVGLLAPALAQSPPLAQPELAEGGKPITLRANRGTVIVVGFGRIDHAYFYDETITPERSAPAGRSVSELLPPVWHLQPGEALRVTLQNKLDPLGGDCQQFRTNLHTHGLLVAPWTTAQSPFGKFGDFVFLDTFPEITPNCSAGSADGTHPSGRAAPGTSSAEYEILLPKTHPSGLFWYHPHPHMLSKQQVGGGMAGLIAVGSLWDYAYLHCSLKEPSAQCQTPADRDQEVEARQYVHERFLLLKDMQVMPHDAPNPGHIQWQYREDADTALCGADPGLPSDQRKGSCSSPQAPGPCLFPVNGQLHPQITVSDAGQVWRIGNTSPNVTYRLALQEGANQLCMQVLSRDGVPIAIGENSENETRSGGSMGDRVFESEIILMPGSRVELFISYPDALNLPPETRLTARGTPCGHPGVPGTAPAYTELVTLGFDTGSNPPHTQQPVGDPWPAIQLAGVELQPPQAAAPSGETRPRMRVAQTNPTPATARPAVLPPAVTLRDRLASDFAAQQSRPDQQSLAQPDGALAALKSKCGPGPAENDDPQDAHAEVGQVRVIWFAVNVKNAVVPDTAPDRDPFRTAHDFLQDVPSSDNSFQLGTEIRDATGQRTWPAGPVQLRTFDANRTDVCVHAGHREIWRLVNLSDETHNFHIHQSKFRVLAVHDPYDQLRHEAPWALTPDQVHDVFPIPKFGYVDIEVGFGVGSSQDVVGGISYDGGQVRPDVSRPVQVGRFVFHCHILEHEDGGMMAVIEVLPRPTQSASKR
jgi:FtsP/CotA-like multicopper oxidase with cupredoxin domain